MFWKDKLFVMFKLLIFDRNFTTLYGRNQFNSTILGQCWGTLLFDAAEKKATFQSVPII